MMINRNELIEKVIKEAAFEKYSYYMDGGNGFPNMDGIAFFAKMLGLDLNNLLKSVDEEYEKKFVK